MNCQVTNLDLCQLKQETFHSPTFSFGDIDVSDDQFIFNTFKSFGSAKKEHPVNWVDDNTVYIESLNLPLGDYFHELIWIHGAQKDVVVQGRLKVTDKGNDCGCTPKNNYEIKVVTSETTVNVNYSERIIERITDKGKSAYEIAVENGFVGTEEEWLESLHGSDGKDFTYADFTPEQIAELQKPASDFVDENLPLVTDAITNAETATTNAVNATNNANQATTEAITATENAITAANNANTATQNANNAADFANSQRGWSPKFVFEEDGATRLVKKLTDYIGGTGTAPTANIGQYVIDGGYTSDKSLATNFKGAQSDNLIVEYIHTSNKEVYISDYDEVTGTFTSVGHGLTLNQQMGFVLNVDSNVFLTPSSFTNISYGTYYRVVDITADTFKLATTNNGAGVIFTKSAGFDLTKWHLESILSYTNITGLNIISDFKVVVSGAIMSQVYYYTGLNSGNNMGIMQQNGTAATAVFGTDRLSANHNPSFVFLESLFSFGAGRIHEFTTGNLVNPAGAIERVNRQKMWNNPNAITQLGIGNTVMTNGSTIKIFKM